MSLKSNPLNENQLAALAEIMKGVTAEQIIWLSGFLEGKLSGIGPANTGEITVQIQPEKNSTPTANLTILYGSETGNAKELADKLAEKASFKNIAAVVVDMYDYNPKNLKEEENVAVIVSTHGEGDPPDMAEDFHKFITGKRAPKLEKLSYSVLALGDKSYKFFCKTGEDMDAAFKNLGAFRIASMVKCDVDYDVPADVWMNNFLLNLTPAAEDTVKNVDPLVNAVVPEKNVVKETSEYSKSKPYLATVLEKVKISGRESDKEVYHVELSLEESGLTYEPGDSVGIFTKNPEALVNEIISKTGLNTAQMVNVKEGEVSFQNALTYHLEITVLTVDLIRKYFEKSKNPEVGKLLNDEKLLDKYLYGHDILDLLEEFPYEWNADKIVEILRPLPPRLYSISSSQDYVGEEVHATISVVRYENKGRSRQGACSSFVADEIEMDQQLPIYIDKNPSFKLPPNGAKIIMVGAGTGVAPYRAFMQDRESKGLKGNSWLFYGDRKFRADFLYQTEWQKYLETAYLEKMEVAFSRDQKEKVYVQHKLKEKQKEVFDWIENGAHFYLCGDMKYMAKDVNSTLLEIIQEQGGVTEEQAKKYLKNLKREKRFQTDVY